MSYFDDEIDGPSDEVTGVRTDRYGRYLLPEPPPEGSDDTPAAGKVKSWTRATTVSSSMEYRGALEAWLLRKTVEGVGMRPDLALKARGADGDKSVLDEVVTEAQAVAGASVGSNQGTGMHGVSREIDILVDDYMSGHEDAWAAVESVIDSLPEQYRADARAYALLLTQGGGIGYLEDSDELVVAHPGLRVAGRFDKIRTIDGIPCIVDLKTQREHPGKYSELPIAMQLSIYARAPWIYDSQGNHPAWRNMPEVNREKAYVIWVPSGRGYAELVEIDISRGWLWVRTALSVREARRVKGLTFTRESVQVDERSRPEAVAPAAEIETVDVGPVTSVEDEWPVDEPAEAAAEPEPEPEPEPAGGTTARKRRCGKCGQVGHNARTCTADESPEPADEPEPESEPEPEPEPVPTEPEPEPVPAEPEPEPVPAEPEPEPPAFLSDLGGTDWPMLFRSARTANELSVLYTRASNAGAWSGELQDIAQARYVELTTKTKRSGNK